MYSLGRVTAVSGAQMTVEADQPLAGSVRIGAMIKTVAIDRSSLGPRGEAADLDEEVEVFDGE